MEVPNERIFRLVCIESVAGDAGAEVAHRRHYSAMARGQPVFLRSIPSRALLYARTGPKMASEACTLRARHLKWGFGFQTA